ncbi:pirin family protein [Rossellomorea aquimaris]|uniref:pirin family protein n=1 Tax=Rossellomorea aquimaris TaxID=189382 RepID=UPI0007D07746|nr:pirin family protein [Rossellomorea aquimaris]
MIKLYPGDERYQADHGWLKSWFSFSFAEYFDANNLNFGPMRVLNDDIIAPKKGFGAHPHRDMEIVSIVLNGQLKHEDNTGEKAVTTYGGIQRMTAGTGVVHSEVNPSVDEEVNLLQMWFLPEEKGLTPSYEKTEFDVSQLKNQLLPVVSKRYANGDAVANIHQDLTIYLSELDSNKTFEYEQEQGRNIFFFVLEGSVMINEVTLNRRDSARISDTTKLHIKGIENCRFMLIDLPA